MEQRAKRKAPEQRMSKLLVSVALDALLCAFCVSASAQQPKKVPQIGYLSTLDAARDSTRTEAIRLALRELGYTEGQNIAIEYRYAEGKRDRYPELAAELVRLKVDIIVVSGGTVMIRAAQNATKTIPIVMAGAPPDPVNAGLVESLARPGGNVTGITILSRDLSGKRLELFKEAVPKIARVAVLYAPASAGAAREVKEVLPAAARAERDCSVLGDTSSGGFREGVRRAEQAAHRWTLPVPGRAPAC
jgi:putative ABC transport system substrate-binding protein